MYFTDSFESINTKLKALGATMTLSLDYENMNKDPVLETLDHLKVVPQYSIKDKYPYF